jgi:hypothetical protein
MRHKKGHKPESSFLQANTGQRGYRFISLVGAGEATRLQETTRESRTTMPNMVSTFTRIYRTQYINTSAAQHLMAMTQAVTEPNEIMLSAREALCHESMTPDKRFKIKSAVEKEIQQAIHSPKSATPT